MSKQALEGKQFQSTYRHIAIFAQSGVALIKPLPPLLKCFDLF